MGAKTRRRKAGGARNTSRYAVSEILWSADGSVNHRQERFRKQNYSISKKLQS